MRREYLAFSNSITLTGIQPTADEAKLLPDSQVIGGNTH